jgi:uncharacterized cupredoxin-like copper-binding protein
VLAGCGGSGKTVETSAGATVQTADAARVITVHETEYRLTPAEIQVQGVGSYRIEAINDGRLTHALTITGHGVTSQTGNIEPGKSATLLFSFEKPGDYRLFCPIKGHAAKGMTATARVHRT